MKKKLFSLFLAAVLTLGTAVPAFAGTTSGSTDVSIETVATTIDITVPDTLPIVFNADGTTTVPTNWTIENDTPLGGIHITSIAMTAKDESASGWKLLPQSADVSNLAANTKQLKFSIGKAGELKCIAPAGNDPAATGSFEFAPEDIQIAAGGSQVLAMAVERGAFTTGDAASSAFTMEIEFAFDQKMISFIIEPYGDNFSFPTSEYTMIEGSTWEDFVTQYGGNIFSIEDNSVAIYGRIVRKNRVSYEHFVMINYINPNIDATLLASETLSDNTTYSFGFYAP